LRHIQIAKGMPMKTSSSKTRHIGVVGLFVIISALSAGSTSRPVGQEAAAAVRPVRAEKLSNVPGKTLTAVVVSSRPAASPPRTSTPEASSPLRPENSATGPAKVYKAGESFWEPAGSRHLISENARATEPASLLAVFVADDGARLTTFGD